MFVLNILCFSFLCCSQT